MAKKNREINITNDNIKGLDIKNGGSTWYSAQGKVSNDRTNISKNQRKYK